MEGTEIVTIEEFETMLDEIVETLPEVFFRELNGGIHAVPGAKLHNKADSNDLWILGEYSYSTQMGRSIVIYYGSFMNLYASCSLDFIRERLRKNVLHEFRHHLESLAGERDLEIEDSIFLRDYLEGKKKGKENF